MENYYLDTLDEIEEMMQKNQLQQAFSRLEQELAMPYIPSDAEERMQKLRKELIYRMAENRERSEPSLDTLLMRLQGKPQSQLAAAEALSSRNLREILPEISDWLRNEPFPEAAALMIEAIAEQQINEEFVLLKDGVEYTFWGDDVVPVSESRGFQKALQYLEEWLGNNCPDLFEMSRTLLIHEVYLFLPLSYEEEEGKDLALEVVREVSSLMDDGETLQRILKETN